MFHVSTNFYSNFDLSYLSSREGSYRSAPISPRFTNSDGSGSGRGSRANSISRRQLASPFFTTAEDIKRQKRVFIRVDSVGGNSGSNGQSNSRTVSRGSSYTFSRGSSRTISRGSSHTISRGSSRTMSRGSSQTISRSGSSGNSEVEAVALQPVASSSSGSTREEVIQIFRWYFGELILSASFR